MAGYRSLGYTSFWENTDFKWACLVSDADDFVYNEMTVHVPMAVHPNPKKVLVIGVVMAVSPKY